MEQRYESEEMGKIFKILMYDYIGEWWDLNS